MEIKLSLLALNYEVLNNEWNIQLIVNFVSKNQNTCDIGKRCLIRLIGPKLLVLLFSSVVSKN